MMPPVLALRAVLITIAVAACAWFALAIRSSHEVDRVSSELALAAKITPAQAHSYDQALDQAATLDPDQTIETNRAEVALHAGNPGAALVIAQRVVKREPDNPYAWLLVRVLAARGHPALFRLAQLRIAQLVPPVSAGG
jgi:predicted Zn-dependent protease